MTDPASEQRPARQTRSERESNALVMVVAIFLGIAVAVMAIIGLWLAISASDARADAEAAAAQVDATASTGSAAHQHGGCQDRRGDDASFAGIAPANADEIAAAHTAFPAAMPALQPGPVIAVQMGTGARTISIAPGITRVVDVAAAHQVRSSMSARVSGEGDE